MAEPVCFTFQSVTGKELNAVKWLPASKPAGILQLVHGMAEHIERYDHLGQTLSAAGYIVVGHTHLGHGPQAQILGYFEEGDGWQHLIDDVHGLRTLMQSEYPDLPYYILGHSMGSFVTRCYLPQYGAGLAGAVISGTGYYPAPLYTAGLLLANLECLFGKKKKPSALIDKIAFSANNKPFEPARTPVDWLSRDQAQVDLYVADPYCGHLFTGSGYRELFRGLKRMSHTGELKKIDPELRILFMSGTSDPVGSMGVGVTRVAEQFRKAGLKQVELILYPDGRHEMLNEINREEVETNLLRWLRK